MSITPLAYEPAAINSGDTLSWLIALPDYPASGGWTLYYTGIKSDYAFNLASAPSGADHAITAAKAATAEWPAGSYTLTKYVDNGTERITLGQLTLTILPDLSGKTAGYDNRSHVKKVLDAIEAVLEGRASTDQQEMTIDGTTIKRMPVTDLLKFRSTYYNYYQQELTASKAAQGNSSGAGKIRVRL